MRLIQGRYRYADAHDMYALLGVKSLPPEGMAERLIQGVRVYVKPLEAQCLQTYCRHCQADIEGFPPTRDWRDRGNNQTCSGTGTGRHHKPAIRPARNFQGLRVMSICECGRHVPVGRMHQHKCS